MATRKKQTSSHEERISRLEGFMEGQVKAEGGKGLGWVKATDEFCRIWNKCGNDTGALWMQLWDLYQNQGQAIGELTGVIDNQREQLAAKDLRIADLLADLLNERPGYSDLRAAEARISELVNKNDTLGDRNDRQKETLMRIRNCLP